MTEHTLSIPDRWEWALPEGWYRLGRDKQREHAEQWWAQNESTATQELLALREADDKWYAIGSLEDAVASLRAAAGGDAAQAAVLEEAARELDAEVRAHGDLEEGALWVPDPVLPPAGYATLGRTMLSEREARSAHDTAAAWARRLGRGSRRQGGFTVVERTVDVVYGDNEFAWVQLGNVRRDRKTKELSYEGIEFQFWDDTLTCVQIRGVTWDLSRREELSEHLGQMVGDFETEFMWWS